VVAQDYHWGLDGLGVDALGWGGGGWGGEDWAVRVGGWDGC